MKIARIIFLIISFLFFTSVYFCTESTVFKEWFGNIKPDEGLFSTDRYRYGDLFGMSFISKFKNDNQKTIAVYKGDTCKKKKNIALYILGDSYVFKFISEKQFCGITKLTLANWDYKGVPIKIDSSATSILIIETTERYLRNRFTYTDNAKNKFLFNSSTQDNLKADNIQDCWQNYFSDNNLHIEALLFDYPFFTPMKQLKADLNFKWLSHLSDEVVLSKNGDRLFLSETINDTLTTGSFSKLDKQEISNLVSNMNSIQEYYFQSGFNKIYFSFIPNPVSMIEPERGNYNHLIERIQNSPDKKFELIDCFELAKSNPEKFYQKSDSHWTNWGCNLWLNKVNELLNEE